MNKKEVYECLRNSHELFTILTNYLRALRCINNHFVEFHANPFRVLQILTNAVANLANACEHLMNEMTTKCVLAIVFSLSLVCQSLPRQLLRQKVKLLSFVMPRGGKKGGGRSRGRERSDNLLINTKNLLPIAQHLVMTQTMTTTTSGDEIKTSRQNKAKVKSAKSVRRPRSENAESLRDEMSDIQSDFCHSPMPPPRTPTAHPPSKEKSRRTLANLYTNVLQSLQMLCR